MAILEAESGGWAKVLAGDRSAFWRLVNPLLEELREAARRELSYMTALGDLDPDRVKPDEIVDEVLVRAWEERRRKPEGVEVKTWLLGLMYRAIDRLVAGRQEDPLDALRLPEDEEVDVRDVIPDPGPTPEEIVSALEEKPSLLGRISRRVLLMHDVHGMSGRQIGAVVEATVRVTTTTLVDARRTIRAHVLG